MTVMTHLEVDGQKALHERVNPITKVLPIRLSLGLLMKPGNPAVSRSDRRADN